MPEKMKKVGRFISICMGITMSLCLSLLGNLTSGRFSPVIFAVTLLASCVISLAIGFIVPMGKVSQDIMSRFKPGSMAGRLLETLVSDLIYTPVITIAMIAIVRAMVPEQALESMPPFGIMFIRSLLMCFVAGFVLIFLLMPIFRNMAFKKYDIPLGPVGGR